MSSNGTTLTDETGGSPDWFELQNAGSEPVVLDGWGVSDDLGRPFKWVFRNAVIRPGEFLVVFASGNDRQPDPTAAVQPASLSGLRLWLRADAVNPNHPTEVRRSGDSIFLRQWLDQSGSGIAAAQGTDAAQPRWIPSGIDGQPSVRFDGVNDQLLLPRPLATNSFTLLAVFRTSQSHEIDPEGTTGVGGVSGQRYLFGAQHGGDDAGGSGLSVGTNGVSVYEHGSGYMPALAVWRGYLGSDPTLVSVAYDAKHLSLDVQGFVARTGMTSPRNQVTAPVEIGLGAYGAFGGDLAEVLLYDRPLSANERRSLATYFAAKYHMAFPQPRHASFQLSADGEDLLLTRPDGSPEDHVRFGPIPRDVSYGRLPAEPDALVFFADPTPGKANSAVGGTEYLAAPAFSHPGGFYTNAFTLTLTTEQAGTDIRYTLDGSEPTENSTRYESPLSIRSRAGTPNVISQIPTVPGGPTPATEVAKAWVVRARAFKAGALPSPMVTRTFWVDSRGAGRHTVPVVSLATDRAHFFDANTGIYVPGNAPGGNYSQRGPEWERPVHVEFYETGGTLAFAQLADVKIHGNTSQGFPIKGLDLDGTGGGGRQPFRYRIFPDRPRTEFEHFLLRPTGHDQPMAFMRDELMQSLGAETGAESQAARACVVYLNGEYWGLHYVKEKEDVEFVAYYADHPADDLDYLEGYAAAKAGDVQHYQALVDYIATHDLRDGAAYAEVQTRMEVPNYIDYKTCEIFFYRWDIGNHRLWRPRTPEGRWRWLQFDNDVGWGGFWAEQPAWAFNMLAADLTPSGSLHDHNNEVTTFLLRRLMVNPDFQRDFINRFQDLLNTIFLPEHTIARIDQLAGVLAPEMAEHTRRWRSPATFADWLNYVQYLRTYAQNRPAYVRQHLRQQFGLRPTARVSLSVAPPQSGMLAVNTLPIRSPTNAPWSGEYFQGHPLPFAAHPAPGYRFVGWDGLFGLRTNRVTLMLNGDLSLTARFEPDPRAMPTFLAVQADPSGDLVANVQGEIGSSYRLEASVDLRQWEDLREVLVGATGRCVLARRDERDGAGRFYRLRIP